MAHFNILFVGDVFGQPGREALLRWLPGVRDERAVDCVIANGENVANGAGITSKLALKLLGGGVDVLTTGNHVWRQKEVYSSLATDERIVRPANYPAGTPAAGKSDVSTPSLCTPARPIGLYTEVTPASQPIMCAYAGKNVQ